MGPSRCLWLGLPFRQGHSAAAAGRTEGSRAALPALGAGLAGDRLLLLLRGGDLRVLLAIRVLRAIRGRRIWGCGVPEPLRFRLARGAQSGVVFRDRVSGMMAASGSRLGRASFGESRMVSGAAGMIPRTTRDTPAAMRDTPAAMRDQGMGMGRMRMGHHRLRTWA